MYAEAGYANVNGRLLLAAEAQVSLFDHGLLYGDGLFETLRVYGGRFFRLDAHLSRLEVGARQLELSLPWGRSALGAALRETAEANGVEDGVVRLSITRGNGPPLPDPELCQQASFFVTARPAGSAPQKPAWTAVTGDEHPRLFVPAVKSLCYLPFQQARLWARRTGADEALLAYRGTLVEGSTANLFVLKNGTLLTPPLSSGCLAGVTRAAVLELAQRDDVSATEADLALADTDEWDEAFLTNSGAGIIPLVELDGQGIGRGEVGAVTDWARRRYRELVRDECRG
jgi:branched-chain amino acid aminotransferase